MEHQKAILQEAEQVFKTKFWSMVMSKIREKYVFAMQRLSDDPMFTSEEHMKHVWWQGQKRALEQVIKIPDSIIEELKKGED